MAKIKKQNKYKNHLFSLIFAAIIVLLAYSATFVRDDFLDIMMVAGFFWILHHFDKIYDFPGYAVSLITLAILLHLFGVLGMYSHFIIPGVIGYDKLVHFTSGFAVAYILIIASKEKHAGLRYTLAILAVMGAGAIVEISEFLGWHYFGINNGGIFTIGDNLPVVTSDLQRFDTYFDMMFNFAGASISVIFVMLSRRFSKKK